MVYGLGVAVLLGLTAAIGGVLTRRSETRSQSVWDIPRVATTFVPIVGALAGFSVASTIFLANLNFARESPAFPSLIGMFVIAFVIFVAAAQEFGMTPNLPATAGTDYERLQRYSYLIAMFGYFIALALSWHALRMLLLTIGLDSIADIFRWILLVIVIAGATRLSVQHLYVLTSVTRTTCLLIPCVGFVAAAVFRLGVVPFVPAISVPADEPFVVAVACFVVATVGFGIQSLLLAIQDHEFAWSIADRHTEATLVAYLTAVTTAVGLLWLAVALA